jgi:nicotinamide-nucleotide amidase
MAGGRAPTFADVAALASRAHDVLLAARATVALAESLTGGLVCAALSERAGASAILRGGLVVYATALKHDLAGVSRQLLDDRGAVDPDVALGLARGARERLGASYGLGLTGVAGPSEQDGQAVGTVFVACAGPDGESMRALRLPGGRREIRFGAAAAGLALLIERCGEESSASLGS